MKKIIHIDMDAFYASVEQRDNSDYRGKPIAVGHAGERGVVAAASYEARKFGVHSAMSSKKALEKCPQLIFVNGRMDVYYEVSQQIRKIFYEYTDLVEPLSLDEAYLDVTQNKKNIPSATLIAKEIKKRIKEETGLTASAGASVNKFLAKIASDVKKPDGLFVITQKDAQKFVEGLKIERFWGVGKVTAQKMYQLGIYTGKDLKKFSEEDLVLHFGKVGHLYYKNALGIDDREVEANRERKSIGAENTFLVDTNDRNELHNELNGIADEVWKRVSEHNFKGRTITLKIKYADFKRITRSKTFGEFVGEYDLFLRTAKQLLDSVMNNLPPNPTLPRQGEGNKDTGNKDNKRIRLIGLSVGNNSEASISRQLRFCFDE